MAIYSLHHQPIGKSTQARPHTSAAHVRYITRPSAASRIEAERMSDKPGKAAAFMVDGENADRKNARVSDKLMLALPRELDAEQRAQLVRGFAEEVTQGRAPWLAAFHDQGKDAHNPHAHLVIRDRDPDSGKRVIGLSEKGSTDRLRSLWETHSNRALKGAGRPERIDRRTLEAQGLRREPTVHEGPKAQQMDRRGVRPESRMRRYRNRPGSHLPYRDVDYRGVDGGRSRPDYNRHVRRPESPEDYWRAVDADNLKQELDQLRQLHHRPVELVEFPLVGRRVKKHLYTVDDVGTRVGAGRGLAQPETHQQGPPVVFPRKHTEAPFEAKPPVNGQSLNKHFLIYRDATGKDKSKMAKRDEDGSPEAKWRANDDKQRELGGTFDHLLGKSYDDKDAALKEMSGFRDNYGNDELFHALRLEPGRFGSAPKDPAKAADAPRYREQLPGVFNGYRDARDEGDRLNHLHGPRPDGRTSGVKDVTPGARPESGLASLWNPPQPSSPSGSAGGIPQETPSQLRASSYPLESPFRAEGKGIPSGRGASSVEDGAKPYHLPSPDEVDNPWNAKPQPARHPLSLRNPATVPEGTRPGESSRLRQEQQPLSLRNPSTVKPQLTQGMPVLPQQALNKNPLETPIQQRPVKQRRKGLDDGR